MQTAIAAPAEGLRRTLWLSAIPILLIAVMDVTPNVPTSLSATVIVLAAFAFLLIHGAAALGTRALVTFIVVVYLISFFAEVVGVATGLLFGPYHYTANLGPRVLGVPPLVQLAYLAMSYASMMTARLLTDSARPTSARWFSAIVVGALLMVGWDVCMDPLQSTYSGDWVWHTGGAYFGVPIHNYVGWFVTVLLFLVVYAFIVRNVRETGVQGIGKMSRAFWNMPVLLYLVLALNVVFTPLVSPLKPPIPMPANYTMPLDTIAWSLTLITVFVMGVPVLVALLRRSDAPADD